MVGWALRGRFTTVPGFSQSLTDGFAILIDVNKFVFIYKHIIYKVIFSLQFHVSDFLGVASKI